MRHEYSQAHERGDRKAPEDRISPNGIGPAQQAGVIDPADGAERDDRHRREKELLGSLLGPTPFLQLNGRVGRAFLIDVHRCGLHHENAEQQQ